MDGEKTIDTTFSAGWLVRYTNTKKEGVKVSEK